MRQPLFYDGLPDQLPIYRLPVTDYQLPIYQLLITDYRLLIYQLLITDYRLRVADYWGDPERIQGAGFASKTPLLFNLDMEI